MTGWGADGQACGSRDGCRDGPPVTRSRRRWALIIVGAVLVSGLAYEVTRFDHGIAGQLPVLLVGGLLAIGLVVVLVDPGRSRVGRAVAGLALAVALVFMVAQLRTSTDPLVGAWTASADGMASTAVSITQSPAGYTVRTTSAARLPGSTCDLPSGAVIATFTGTAQADHGQQSILSRQLRIRLGDGGLRPRRERGPEGHCSERPRPRPGQAVTR